MIVAALIAMVKPLSSFTAPSTTKPRGTSSEKSNPCIALIPNPNQNQIGASISSDLSQSPYSGKMWGPVSAIIDSRTPTRPDVASPLAD
jgi:hypothetical protein